VTTRKKSDDDDAAAETPTAPPAKKGDAEAKARAQLERGEITWREYLAAVDAG